jgi:hypothetical protein
VIRAGKIVGLVECDILDERQRLVARASSTCMTLRGRLAGGRELTPNRLDKPWFGQPAENRERQWERRGSQLLTEQIDTNERLPWTLA